MRQIVLELNSKPYCNCHESNRWHKQDGYSLDTSSGLWVCTRCRKPSKMNYERHVLKKPQIPQQRKTEDIYYIELSLWAQKEIDEETNWKEVIDESNEEDRWLRFHKDDEDE